MANEKIPFAYQRTNSNGNFTIAPVIAGYNIYINKFTVQGNLKGNTRWYIANGNDLTIRPLCIVEATGILAAQRIFQHVPFTKPFFWDCTTRGALATVAEFIDIDYAFDCDGWYMKITP